jgi:sugar lactone lactonase YvrE
MFMKHFPHLFRSHGLGAFLPRRIVGVLLLATATQAGAVITIDTAAGTGINGYGGDGGLATAAQLSGPRGVAVDKSGRVYIADSDSNIVRRIKLDGTIETIAGVQNGPSCTTDYSGDNGPATSAHLGCPHSVATDSQGNLYIADTHNHRIRMVDASGNITTVAGTGTQGFSGDGGLAINAQLDTPFNIVIDTQNRVYISDQGNRRVRRVEADGTITTVAGDGSATETGNGGPATSAGLGGIWGIGLDAQDRLYITNVGSVRRVESSGLINRVAGDGSGSYSGDGGAALSAGMIATGIMIDASGRMYIADSSQRIRRVGLDGIINTVAGNGSSGFSGDGGDALLATFDGIYGLTIGNKGLLYFPDYSNSRIRVLTLDVPSAPLSVTATASNAQASVTWTVPASTGGSPITGYVVTAVEDPSRSCTATPPDTSCTVLGLTNGTTYTFIVRGDNANGAGAESAISNGTTPRGATVLSETTPVPTLSEWMLLALSALMMLAMVLTVRRQR